jgi:CheY-like chemotaxis protein
VHGRLRVLVIDDDDISREIMLGLLEAAGHQVSGLPSPIGATKHILDTDIQVMVVDIMMPSMRGDKLAALLSRNPKLRGLGVVLVTGAPSAELASLAAELKARAWSASRIWTVSSCMRSRSRPVAERAPCTTIGLHAEGRTSKESMSAWPAGGAMQGAEASAWMSIF